MARIKFLDPEDTGSVTWHGKSFRPNQAVDVDSEADAALIAAASASPGFWKVTGLTGDDKEAVDAAREEAEEMAEREAAALRAEEETEQAAAGAERAKSEELTKPGAAEAAKQAVVKKPGAR